VATSMTKKFTCGHLRVIQGSLFPVVQGVMDPIKNHSRLDIIGNVIGTKFVLCINKSA
jgi:hypothetical protein